VTGKRVASVEHFMFAYPVHLISLTFTHSFPIDHYCSSSSRLQRHSASHYISLLLRLARNTIRKTFTTKRYFTSRQFFPFWLVQPLQFRKTRCLPSLSSRLRICVAILYDTKIWTLIKHQSDKPILFRHLPAQALRQRAS
jgi:hypothetical protein